jgi:hypothetical protein
MEEKMTSLIERILWWALAGIVAFAVFALMAAHAEQVTYRTSSGAAWTFVSSHRIRTGTQTCSVDYGARTVTCPYQSSEFTLAKAEELERERPSYAQLRGRLPPSLELPSAEEQLRAWLAHQEMCIR